MTDPTRVRVPSIGLDAPVVPVGLRSDGQMEVPAASDVGWYRLGPAPGDTGSAVLAAHVDYGGQRGAFFDLRSVPVGAEVFVDGDGTTRRFVVSLREQLPKDAVALERYFTAEGPERLTLITCGGAFDRGAGHYVDNIILTADLAT
jgi:sortase (surface protein transpeptidase)